jgi:hypothetical protein
MPILLFYYNFGSFYDLINYEININLHNIQDNQIGQCENMSE